MGLILKVKNLFPNGFVVQGKQKGIFFCTNWEKTCKFKIIFVCYTDEEFLTLKKSYQNQKRLGAITFTRPKKTDLFPLTTKRPLPVLVISADLGTMASKYRLPNFIKIPQKLNDPDIVKW